MINTCTCCAHQHRQREGDASDGVSGQRPDRPVRLHAARPAAVDPQAHPLRPLPSHGSHLPGWEPDGGPYGPAAEGTGETPLRFDRLLCLRLGKMLECFRLRSITPTVVLAFTKAELSSLEMCCVYLSPLNI